MKVRCQTPSTDSAVGPHSVMSSGSPVFTRCHLPPLNWWIFHTPPIFMQQNSRGEKPLAGSGAANGMWLSAPTSKSNIVFSP